MKPRPIETRYHIEPAPADCAHLGPCWIWHDCTVTAARGRKYGKLKRNGKNILAHRASYEENVGPIPPDHVVHHRCRHTLCVAPRHLQAIGQARNIKEAVDGGHHPTAKNGKPVGANVDWEKYHKDGTIIKREQSNVYSVGSEGVREPRGAGGDDDQPG